MKIIISIAFLLLPTLLLPQCAFAESSFDWSGFARIVGGHIDDDRAEFEGYSDSFSLSEDSLFALQGNWYLDDQFELAGQLLAHSSEKRESGIEWAYIKYQPLANLQLKAGRLRTPFFLLSDVLDVGFAYPYVRPPVQVYFPFLFNQYDGVNAIYTFNYSEIRASIEAYTGRFSGETSSNGVSVDATFDNIYGGYGSVGYGNFDFRLGFFTSDIDNDIPEIDVFVETLNALNFSNSADSLGTNGRVSYSQASIKYDNLDWFVQAEFVKYSSDIPIAPSIAAGYITVGKYLPPYSVFATLALGSAESEEPVNEIPLGFDPQLDLLAATYINIYEELPINDLASYSIGVRWDVRYNLALKAEFTFLDGERGEEAFFEVLDPSFDSDAVLSNFALEWVF